MSPSSIPPAKDVVPSTYFGGSADDTASAMTVDPAGNVYVTGTTSSLDFPLSKGAYASKGSSFVFRLNPDGSLSYSTYFASSASPIAIAVDAAGSAYIAGTAGGNLPVTPGAYQSTCNCAPVSTGFLTIIVVGGFITKFDATRIQSALFHLYRRNERIRECRQRPRARSGWRRLSQLRQAPPSDASATAVMTFPKSLVPPM